MGHFGISLEDLAFISRNRTRDPAEIAADLNLPLSKVVSVMITAKYIPKANYSNFSLDDRKFIKTYMPILRTNIIADILGKTKTEVLAVAFKEGVSVKDEVPYTLIKYLIKTL